MKKTAKQRTAAFLRLLLYLMSVICVLGFATYFALQARPVQDALKQLVSQAIEKNIGKPCRIEGLSGNMLTGFKIKGLKLSDPKTGLPLMSANRIDVSYSAPMLLAKVLWINHLTVDGAAVDLVRSPDGKWNLEPSPAQKTEKKSGPVGFNIIIRKINIRNSKVSVSQPGTPGKTVRQFRKIECRASLRIGSTIFWRISHFAFRLDRPDLVLTDAGGSFSYSPEAGVFDFSGIKLKTRKSFLTIDGRSDFSGNRPQLNIQAGVKALSLSEIGQILSIDMMGGGIITGDLQAKGTLEKMEHHLKLKLNNSRVQSSGVIHIDESNGIGCDIIGSLRELDPSAFQVAALKPLAGMINADISIRGQHLNLPDRAGRISIAIRSSRFRDYPVDLADVTADIKGTDLILEALRLETPFGKLSGTGSLSGMLSEKQDIRIRFDAQIKGLNPQAFISEPVFSTKTDVKDTTRLAGNLSVSGKIEGMWDKADIQAKLEAKQIAFQQTAAESMTATANWRGDMKDFVVSGRCGLRGLRTRLMQISDLDLKTTMTPAAASLDLSLNGSHKEQLTLHADIRDWMEPVKEVRLKRLSLISGNLPPLVSRGPARLKISADHIDIDTLKLASGDASLELKGCAGFGPPCDLSATLLLRDFDVNRLSGFVKGLEPVRGRVSADIALSGLLQAPVLDIKAFVTEGAYHDFPVSKLTADITYKDAEAFMKAEAFTQNRKFIDINGTAPVLLSLYPFALKPQPRGLNVSLGLDRMNISKISALKHPEYDLRGVVTGRVQISGDLNRPMVTGRIGLQDGSLNLIKQGLSYETLTADLRLEPGVINISDMEIKGNKEGTLHLSGSVTYNGFTPGQFNVRATGDDFYIPFHSGIDARITPDVTLSGGWASPNLTGEVTITKGRFNLGWFYETETAEIKVVQAVPDENGVIQIPEKGPEALSFVDPMAADIRVVIPKNVWLRDRDEAIEIKGDVNLKKQPHRPFVLFGPLYSVRGTYRFHGKVFNITRGELNFIGQEEINPPLNIDAETRIKDVKIIIHLTGTYEKFNIALDSEPAMDQTDIISYLMFGRPQDSLAEGESFSAAGAALSMTGQIAADELRDVLGDKFRVDYIDISAGSGDIRQGSFAMGKYVTPKVFVVYRQGFTKDSPRQVEVDYEINKHFSLETQVDDEKTSAVDLIWKHEF